MQIKNNGKNVYYIVNKKESLTSQNILFDKNIEIVNMLHKEFVMDNKKISMDMSEEYKYFIISIEKCFFIFDNYRISEQENYFLLTAKSEDEIFQNFLKLTKKLNYHFNEDFIKYIVDYLDSL